MINTKPVSPLVRVCNYCLIKNHVLMKILKNSLSLTLLILAAYSCEPEELPIDESMSVEEITANGEHDGEVEDRRGNP